MTQYTAEQKLDTLRSELESSIDWLERRGEENAARGRHSDAIACWAHAHACQQLLDYIHMVNNAWLD